MATESDSLDEIERMDEDVEITSFGDELPRVVRPDGTIEELWDWDLWRWRGFES